MKTLTTIFVGLVIAVFLTAAGCERIDKMQSKAADETPKAEGASGKEGTVTTGNVANVVIATEGGPAAFAVEIAQSDEERARGLMGRESLPENVGMFFIFPQMNQEKFWMKDTKIPLDIIFIDEVTTSEGFPKPGNVVYVIENAVPESTELLSSPVPYRFVLEVGAGTAARYGIRAGNAVERRIGPL